MFSTTASSSPHAQAAAVATLAGAAAATTTAMTTTRHMPAWLLAPWTSLLAPLLRFLSTWLRTRLLALLPAPLHFVLGRTSRSLDTLLAALAVILSATLAHQRLVPLIAQRILDTATLTLGALDMVVNGPTSVLTSITSVLKIPGPPLATKMVADREPMRIVYRGRVVAYASLKGVVSVPAGGGVVPMDALMSVSNGKPKVDSLEQGFSEFCRDLVQATGQVKFGMVGDQVEIRILGGRIGVPGLKLNKSVSLPGMGGLGDMAIDSVLLVDSTLSSLILECTCSIINPSSVSMTAGTVAFGMTTPDLYESAMSTSSPSQEALASVTLASISITSMRLVPGRNTLTAICTMRRPHPATQPNSTLVTAGLRILSRYLTGQPSDVVVFGVSAGESARYLTPAIQSVVTHTVLPPLLDPIRGIPPQLLVQTSLSVSQVSLVSQSVPTRITLANPFPLGMTITRMRGLAYLSNSSAGSTKRVPMGTLDASVMLYVPGSSQGVTPDETVPMKLALGVSQLAAVAGSGGELRVDVECEIDCRVGLCVVAGVAYKQAGVRVIIKF